MGSLEFFIDLILLSALRPWGQLSLYLKWVPRVSAGGIGGRYVGLTTLPPPVCSLEILGASTSWNPQGVTRPVWRIALPLPLHLPSRINPVEHLKINHAIPSTPFCFTAPNDAVILFSTNSVYSSSSIKSHPHIAAPSLNARDSLNKNSLLYGVPNYPNPRYRATNCGEPTVLPCLGFTSITLNEHTTFIL